MLELFSQLFSKRMRQPRFERGTFGSGGRRSIQLSYWRAMASTPPFKLVRAGSTRYSAPGREREPEGAAFPDRALHPDAAAVRFHREFAERQT